MTRRTPETFADYLAVAVSPALIMLLVGSLVFRELSLKSATHSFVQAATRAGLVLFIVAAMMTLARFNDSQ